MIVITCPKCGFQGSEDDFDMSLCDECFCPNGCDVFELEMNDDDDDDEEEGDPS